MAQMRLIAASRFFSRAALLRCAAALTLLSRRCGAMCTAGENRSSVGGITSPLWPYLKLCERRSEPAVDERPSRPGAWQQRSV